MARIFTPKGERGIEYYDSILKELEKEVRGLNTRIRNLKKLSKKASALDLNLGLQLFEGVDTSYTTTPKGSKTLIKQKQEAISKLRKDISAKKSMLSRVDNANLTRMRRYVNKKWKEKGQETAQAAREGSRDIAGSMQGKEAHDLYSYVVDSIGDRKYLETYDSDDILESADDLIKKGKDITRKSLDDAIRESRENDTTTADDIFF